MARYIDADWIAQRLDGWQDQLAKTYGENDEYVLCLGEVLMKIDDAPTADVVERRKGKWLYLDGLDAFECSVCGRQMVRNIFDYCPWCGAEMRERREEET